MTSYDLGDGVNLEHLVYDRDHQLTDAVVAVTVIKPDGQQLTPTVTRLSLGTYRAATLAADVPGRWTYAVQVTGAVTDVVLGAFTVEDPRPALYTDLVTVKAGLTKSTADDRDDLIEKAIAAASRWIDRRCGTRFYADRLATARTFAVAVHTVHDGGLQVLLVDDIASLQNLAVATGGTGAWTPATGWEAGPDNAAAYGRPYTQLRGMPGWLPSCRPGWAASTVRVQVTARWGWPAVPDEIAQAAQLLAARLYRRKDSPQGVIPNADWGPTRVSRTDPDVEALIAPFVIPAIA